MKREGFWGKDSDMTEFFPFYQELEDKSQLRNC